MPSDLLEKPIVKDAPGKVSVSRPLPIDSAQNGIPRTVRDTSAQPKTVRERTKAVLQSIFKGHNEFLGWTPD